MERLGDDTAELQLRVGLHSGPVTGGVLRGKKARFQLFGDTVNTASRTESTGMGGRIHITDATANELISKGKAHWLKGRQEKVIAKGKGEMQTYWLEVQSTASDTSYLRRDVDQTVEALRARLASRYKGAKTSPELTESTSS